ncbi:MAG: hypothetical protein BWK75_00190 [Candidatus Altiarchaeales archaeon A3]|nr:MAG: hypothetical protein BWK75_00190 [Candidatus Altiarchaeales archaeon A3]
MKGKILLKGCKLAGIVAVGAILILSVLISGCIENDDAIKHNDLGVSYYESGNFEEAEKEYKEAIKINPNFATAHYNLESLLINLTRYEEAEEEFREAIKINPNFAEAHAYLGLLLYVQTKNKDKAKEEILKAKDLFEKQGRINDVKLCDEYLKKFVNN